MIDLSVSLFGVPAAVFAAVLVLLSLVGVVKGTTGFGSGLLSVPIVIQVFPPAFALAALTLPLWLGNLPVLAADGVPWRTLRARAGLLVAAVAGVVVGLLGVAAVPARAVYLLVGGYLVAFLLVRRSRGAAGRWVRGRVPERGAGVLVGGVGGAINGAFLSGGPVFVSYFHATQGDRTRFATTLSFLFFLSTTVRLAALYPLGLFGPREVALGLGFLLPLAVGVYAGTRLRPHVPQARFEALVDALLVAIAAKLALDGLAPLP